MTNPYEHYESNKFYTFDGFSMWVYRGVGKTYSTDKKEKQKAKKKSN